MSITLELDLPDKLAAEAKANGLFESASLSGLLEDELRRRRAGQELVAALSEIRRQPGPAPTEDEIQAEIAAVRKSRRRAPTRRRIRAHGSLGASRLASDLPSDERRTRLR
jgi:hypothetical protein